MSTRNPKTGKIIKIGGPTYKQLQKEGYFKTPNRDQLNKTKTPQKEQWVINPKTGRKVKVGSKTYMQMQKEQLNKSKSPNNISPDQPKKEEQINKPKLPNNKSPKAKPRLGLTVAQLKEHLKQNNLSTKGLKAELEKRYNDFLAAKQPIPKDVVQDENHKHAEDDVCKMRTEQPPSQQDFEKRNLSPTKKQTVELPKEDNIRTPSECCICGEHNELIAFDCVHTVCKECKMQMPKTECPMCRKDVSRFFTSPTSSRKQKENYASFKKFIEMEKTADDLRIATELQLQMNREMLSMNQFPNPNKGGKKSVKCPNIKPIVEKKVVRRTKQYNYN